MMNNLFKNAIDKIKDSKSICVISHVNPDGDSIGSTLALGMALMTNVKGTITVAKSDVIPESFTFLSGIEEYREINKGEKFDLLITLDCSDSYRLGNYSWIMENSNYVINIDHHVSNNNFGNLNIVDSGASSTGEIVYRLLTKMGITITKEIATLLYVAISTDTGSFKYDSTSSSTHRIAANLLECDIDLNCITRNIYQSRSLSKTNTLIGALNTLKLYNDNKIGIVFVTQDMLNKTNSSIYDVEGIIDFVRDIDTVEVACILKEVHPLEIKASFRSKKYVDVAKIAEYFNGGGHKRAAGCTIKDNIKNAEKEILDIILKTFR